MDKNIKINVSDNVQTLLIGEALTPKEPRKITINGNFSAVSEYVSKREESNCFQKVKTDESLVVCNREKMTIHLFTSPNDPFGTEVIGTAEISDELKEFGINQNKIFSREQLIKLFRFNRRFFPNKEENANLLSKYQNFSATVNKSINAESDQRGNRNNQLTKKVNTDLPENFVLEIPIFKGEKPVTFPVEICIEDLDSGVRFWFESVELSEIIADFKDKIFASEIKYFESLPIIFE